ncbi:MAG: GNAT family N-acetyltransferase [Clostridiaceae bacterium]
MELRKTTEQDIPRVMEIIRAAQRYFREANIYQWVNNYPNEEIIKEDISKDYSYVLVHEGKIAATAAVAFDGESTYEKIYEGNWITDGEYAVIHRIAVAEELKGQGVASEVLKKVEELCRERQVNSIKIDTHEDNKSMQRLMEKNGFVYCGIIYLESGSKRIAFEKLIL